MKYKSRACFFAIGLFVLTAAVSFSQDKIRTIEKGYLYPKSPIEVVSRDLGIKPFMDDTRVLGDREWLKQLTLGIKNVSNKNIISFDIDLVIKKQGKVLMGIPIYFRTYTKPDALNALTPQGDKKLGVLQPGEVVKVKISDRDITVFGNELKKHDVEDVERVTMDFRFVYFDDGTRWSMGQEGPYNRDKSVRPSKSKPALSQRVAEWMKNFLAINSGSCSKYPLAFIFPTSGRGFFTHPNARIASPPLPPPTCVWFVEAELDRPLCDGVDAHGCTDFDTFCIYEDFAGAVHTSDPGGAIKGYLNNNEPYICRINPEIPDPPTCSSCQPFTHDVFRADSTCGSPGTCAQPAWWGCATGFVNIAGICQRSLEFQSRCAEPSGYDELTCSCPDGTNGGSPILVDIDNSGFSLTDAANGVDFDLLGLGFAQRFSWTAPGSTNAFLALDRNGNGMIDSGEELFGDITQQVESSEPNGFLALAEYDKAGNGGDDNGKINQNDVIFSQLRLWQDTNHNGVSEASELHTLSDLGLATLELDYHESGRTDEYGNRFKYRAKVRDAQGHQLGRWAWDVFFVMSP